MKTPTNATPKSNGGKGTPPQDIEKLRLRHRELDTKKIQAAANLKTANEALERLKMEALRDYETDDLDKLKEMLKKMEEDNERDRAEYEKQLDELSEKLTEVDKNFEDKKKEQEAKL